MMLKALDTEIMDDLVRAMVNNGVQLTTYDTTKQYLKKLFNDDGSGAGSGSKIRPKWGPPKLLWPCAFLHA